MAIPEELGLQAVGHKLHGGGVQPNLARHVQQTPQHGDLAVGPNAAWRPTADALHMQDPATLSNCRKQKPGSCYSAHAAIQALQPAHKTRQLMNWVMLCTCSTSGLWQLHQR